MIVEASPDPPEIENLLWSFPAGEVAYDVGANVGRTLKILSKRFSRVFAYEPSAECLPFLRATADVLGNATVCPYALSSSSGEVELQEQSEAIKSGQLTTRLGFHEGWGAIVGERLVKCSAMDDEFPAPDFVKVDVECHEVEVIKGALRTVAEKRPHFFIEVHSQDLGKDLWRMLGGFYPDLRTVRHPNYAVDSWEYHNHFYLVTVP